MANKNLWPTLDDAMRSRLFQQCRGIMGTANHGQDEALWRVLEHFHKTLNGIDQDAIDRFHHRLDELRGAASGVSASDLGACDAAQQGDKQ